MYFSTENITIYIYISCIYGFYNRHSMTQHNIVMMKYVIDISSYSDHVSKHCIVPQSTAFIPTPVNPPITLLLPASSYQRTTVTNIKNKEIIRIRNL